LIGQKISENSIKMAGTTEKASSVVLFSALFAHKKWHNISKLANFAKNSAHFSLTALTILPFSAIIYISIHCYILKIKTITQKKGKNHEKEFSASFMPGALSFLSYRLDRLRRGDRDVPPGSPRDRAR
jgi:hypothetical protein